VPFSQMIAARTRLPVRV